MCCVTEFCQIISLHPSVRWLAFIVLYACIVHCMRINKRSSGSPSQCTVVSLSSCFSFCELWNSFSCVNHDCLESKRGKGEMKNFEQTLNGGVGNIWLKFQLVLVLFAVIQYEYGVYVLKMSWFIKVSFFFCDASPAFNGHS